MGVKKEIFREYDIRGLFGSDLTKEVAGKIGQAFGTYLRRKNPAAPKIAVGRDNRFSSDELRSKLVEGLLSTGAFVTDIGLAVTPLVHFATIRYDFDAGVMVTASHNPKEFNGFRLELKGSRPFYGPALQDLYSLIEKEDFARGIGQAEYREDVFNDYLLDLKSKLKVGRRLKIVLDCANAAASKFAPRLFESFGFEVVGLYCSLDGDYPYHQPDPEERVNLETLSLRVREEKADLGFGFDTDADRFGVVDETGRPYENDRILAVLAREILKRRPGGKVAFDVKSSYILPTTIENAGGVAVMLRTGHPYFRQFMIGDPKAILGGELSSHTFINDNYYGYDDGLLAGLRVASLVSLTKVKLSELMEELPKTAHTEELKLPCPDERKFEIIAAVGNKLSQGRVTSRIDGFRIKFSEKSWALIRASNTAPYLSVRFEAEDQASLVAIVREVREEIEKQKEVDASALQEDSVKEKIHFD